LIGKNCFRATNVQVRVGIVARVDAHLQVGIASQSITVDASAQTLQTEQAVIHDEVDQKSLENLPSSNRQELPDLSEDFAWL